MTTGSTETKARSKAAPSLQAASTPRARKPVSPKPAAPKATAKTTPWVRPDVILPYRPAHFTVEQIERAVKQAA